MIKRIQTGSESANSILKVRTEKSSIPPAMEINILTPKRAAATAKITAAAAKQSSVFLSVVFLILTHIKTPYRSAESRNVSGKT